MLSARIPQKWWFPAMRLMNRLNYHSKFALLLSLVAFPLAFLLFAVFSEIGALERMTSKERLGVNYIRALRGLLEPLQDRRGLVYASRRGQSVAEGLLADAELRGDRAIAEVDAIEQTLGDSLSTRRQWNALKTKLREDKAESSRLLPEEKFEADSARVADVMALIVHVGDSSGLIMDPQLITYYLMDTVVGTLPPVIEAVARLRGFGAGRAFSRRDTREAPLRQAVAVGILEGDMRRLERGLAVVFENSADMAMRLKERLIEPSNVGRVLVHDLGASSGRDVFAQGSRALKGYFLLYDESLRALDQLLEIRMAGFARKKTRIAAVILLVSALLIYLYVGFYWSMMDVIFRLGQSAECMAGGEYDRCVILENRDELGEVARSFNRISSQVRAEYERARAAEARLRVQYELGRVLAESSSLEEAAPHILRVLCVGLGWDLCNLWMLDEKANALRYKSSYQSDSRTFPEFSRLSRETAFPPGIGLPGRAWTSAAPAWVLDVKEDSNFPRLKAAQTEGLHSGLAFPLLGSQGVFAVVELYSQKVIPLDHDIVKVLETAGVQIGQFHERWRAEKEGGRLREAMRQAEKMSAVGQLAAGLAHEINNPMGVILGFSQSVLRRLPAGDALCPPLESIEREALRCRRLVQDLLTFSRVSRVEREPVSLTQALDSVLSLVHARARTMAVKVVTELEPDLPQISANAHQIQQVLFNLANNAMDAMVKGGELKMRTTLLRDDHRSWACLWIADTGSGIAPEVLPRIFEPFFTTKPVGQGTGLGLGLVYEIIQKHSGTIDVKSRPGFTEFCVKFPIETGSIPSGLG